MEFKYASNPIVDADIDAVEERFGFTFPADLREIYKTFNGGRPTRDRYIADKTHEIVDAFLPIKHSSSPLSTIERSIERIKVQRQLLPDHLVPFAADPFGSYFCFSLRNDEFGAVYIFRMDRWQEPTHAKRLAGSVSEFLHRLVTKA